MTDTPRLFEPLLAGSVELANRVVMAPMTRSRAGEGNVPTELMATYYVQRASSGLIVTEATQVSEQGVGYPSTPGIHTDAQVEGWRRVVDAVHAAGGRIFLQLWHVGRISHPSMQPGGALPVAPSAVAAKGKVFTSTGPQAFVAPRALELEEIAGVVAQFADGARRAKEAGFDGVEIHGANGYLIEQFLYDATNLRTDAYGGSIENRARFLFDVVEAVVDVWGGDRVGLRLSPRNTFNDMESSDRAELYDYVTEKLGRFGLAYLHVVERVGDAPAETGEGERITPRMRERFGGPLILNGGYDGAAAERALENNEGDAVAFGVPYIANPDLAERLREGAPLAAADSSTFYGGDARGYTDYPTRERVAESAPARA